MTQPFAGNCPQCNTAVGAGYRFCPHCGATMNGKANLTTARPVDDLSTIPAGSGAVNSSMRRLVYNAYGDVIPPPPPGNIVPSPMPSGTTGLRNDGTPPLAKAPIGSKGRLIASVILLLILLLGGSSVYVIFFRSHGPSPSNTNGSQAHQQKQTLDGTNGSPTASAMVNLPMTEQLHVAFTYASVQYTLLSVQQATSFSDDPSAHLRINLHEQNVTTYKVGFSYSEVAQLLLPDGTTLPLANAQFPSGPDPSTQRTNWFDFVMTTPIPDLSKLSLRMGAATESHVNIPLKSNADLSQYQSKLVTLNQPISYSGLRWTLQTAEHTLSSEGQQATTGMRYVVLTFTVDNPTAKTVYINSTSYARLQSGSVTNAPLDTTLPVVNSGTTGATGTMIFLMPANDSAFTLQFLPASHYYDPPSSVQVNSNFQL